MTLKDYVQILSALLTPITTILTIYIAWQQYQVNHFSLRNQLYERRLRVFQTFMSYLSDITREGKTNYQRTVQFYAETREAVFLFDDEIPKRAKEFYYKGIKLSYLREQLYPSTGEPGLPVGDERSRIAHDEEDLLKWFLDQLEVTEELFKQQMKITRGRNCVGQLFNKQIIGTKN